MRRGEYGESGDSGDSQQCCVSLGIEFVRSDYQIMKEIKRLS